MPDPIPFSVPPITHKYSVRDFILTLDPERDHQLIGFLSACLDFPWDTARSLEFALFRTFGVAKGTPLLAHTGEFVRRTRKRYDDTVLLLAHLLEYGYDSPQGRAALRRINQQHARYAIPNDEMLYTLSTFVFEPLRWNARFGWWPVTEVERQASFFGWREIGRRMNIRDLPEDLDEFEAFNVAYEREHFRRAASNEVIAAATRDLLLSMYLPKPLWRFGAQAVYALVDEPLRRAVGFPDPPPFVRPAVEGALKLRGHALKLWPPRREPHLLTRQRYPSYPNGVRVEELGADRG